MYSNKRFVFTLPRLQQERTSSTIALLSYVTLIRRIFFCAGAIADWKQNQELETTRVHLQGFNNAMLKFETRP